MPKGAYKRQWSVPQLIIGQRFGRYVIVKYDVNKSKQNKRDYYLCHCDCGIEKVIRGLHLRGGAVVSCGCWKREKTIERNKTLDRTGENNSQYIHGFNSQAEESHRELIRQRDEYQCQRCGKTQKENGRKLDVHHIDSNHYNNTFENEISLCCECHGFENTGKAKRFMLSVG